MNYSKPPKSWENQVGYRQFIIKLIESNDSLRSHLKYIHDNDKSIIESKTIEHPLKNRNEQESSLNLHNSYNERELEDKTNPKLDEEKNNNFNSKTIAKPLISKETKDDFYKTGLSKNFNSNTKELEQAKTNNTNEKNQRTKFLRNMSQSILPITSMMIMDNNLNQNTNTTKIKNVQNNLHHNKIKSNIQNSYKKIKPVHKISMSMDKPFLDLKETIVYTKEIKHPEVNKLFNEINRCGPKNSNCNSCYKHNIDFYNKMDAQKAVELLNFFKYKRVKLTKFD